MSYSLIFGADLVPTQSNEKYFVSGDAGHLLGEEMAAFLSSGDFRCFNLETPLSEREYKPVYPGPYLGVNPETIHAISAMKPSLLTLGNNHALDKGEKGLEETIGILRKAGIAYTGAGRNLEEAGEPFIAEVGSSHVGIFNCTEYEFAAASRNTWGANPYDPLVSFDQVRELKSRCDVVIVLYHGGKEFYRYPSPQLQRVCRKFVECGADVVICQHTHCIGCEERYQNGRIIYGQGNLLFDRKENEFKKTGLLIECTVDQQNPVSIRYIPFRKQGECVRMASEEEAELILAAFQQRSEEIKDEHFITEAYDRLAEQNYAHYVRELLGRNRFADLLNRITRGRFYDHYYSARKAAAVLNAISTDNHAELIKAALRLKETV